MKTCPECGTRLSTKDVFCSKCGYKLPVNPTVKKVSIKDYKNILIIGVVVIIVSCLVSFGAGNYCNKLNTTTSNNKSNKVSLYTTSSPLTISAAASSIKEINQYIQDKNYTEAIEICEELENDNTLSDIDKSVIRGLHVAADRNLNEQINDGALKYAEHFFDEDFSTHGHPEYKDTMYWIDLYWADSRNDGTTACTIAYNPNNKTYAVNNADAELYYKMFPDTKPQLEQTSIDDRLKSYATNITSLYDKDIDVTYNNVKFKFADLSSDYIPELIAIGINNDNLIAYFEIYYYGANGIETIDSEHCLGYNGGCAYPIIYKDKAYICGESFSSDTGFRRNVCKYDDSTWKTVFSSHTEFNPDTGQIQGYIVNDAYVSESKYAAFNDDIDEGRMTIDDFVPANQL